MKRKEGFFPVLAMTVRKNVLLTVLLFISIIGAVVFSLLPPLVLGSIINALADRKTVLLSSAFLYFLILVGSGILDFAKEVMITIFGRKISHMLRSRMCEKIIRLHASYLSAGKAGDLTSRFVNDVDTVETLFTDGIISMFTDACKVIGILIAIFFMSRGLGLLMLIATPMLFWLTRAFQKRMLAAQTANRTAIGRVNSQVPETILNIRMITSFAKQKYMEKRYGKAVRDSYRAMDRSNFFDSVYSPIIILTSTVIIAVMMIFAAMGGTMQDFFGMNVGTAVAVIAYVGKVFNPLESIGMEIQSIQSAAAGVRRVNEFLDAPERTVPTEPAGKEVSQGIVLKDVCFSYDPGKPVLNGLSFRVRAGEHVTLMGRTGAGKSTVFKLLLGLYSPDSGQVCIFGTDADRIADCGKRSLFGYVEQDFHPVPGTVAEQISLYDDAVTPKRIENAARLAGLHEMILSLEKGYDTPFRTELFSQGQLQLLSIARAAALDPPILLLDEMTANLDSGTEAKVTEALKKASGNRTVISISHRLYTQGDARIIRI